MADHPDWRAMPGAALFGEYRLHRFLMKIDWNRPADQCWNWRNATGAGYGRFRMDAGLESSHRAMFLLVNGPDSIPPGHVVMHTCDNRLCCNPAHLVLGTQIDNIADMDAKQRRGRAVPYTHQPRPVRPKKPRTRAPRPSVRKVKPLAPLTEHSILTEKDRRDIERSRAKRLRLREGT